MTDDIDLEAFDSVPNVTAVPHNLPLQPTPFIGRETELSGLDRLFADDTQRLLVIVGPGGMGKTRLALAAAEAQRAIQENGRFRFPDGVFFIPLASLATTDQLAPTIIDTLGLRLEVHPEGLALAGRARRSPEQQLLDFLRAKRLLLVLDNFEHLLPNNQPAGIQLPSGGQLLSDILQTAPGVHLLVTTRERLNLREEQIYPIQGLTFPDWETPGDALSYTAVKLFLQSARQVQPDFMLAASDLKYMTRICRLVAGMPLALELAAGWMGALSMADIAAEIQQDLSVLETDLRNVPDRHRSIRSILDYSWQRLSATEQATFVQLTVFHNHFTLPSAVAVVNLPGGRTALLRVLAALVNQSLLQFNKQTNRYQLHSLLRQFGAERLAENGALKTAVLDRHSQHFCQAIQHLATQYGGQQNDLLTAIEAILNDAHAAWQWAAHQQQVACLAQAMDGLNYFYWQRGRYQEGQTICRTAITHISLDTLAAPAFLARLYVWQSRFALATGQQTIAATSLQQSLALLAQLPSDPVNDATRAFALEQQGAQVVGADRQQAQTLYGEALVLYQKVGDQQAQALVLSALGTIQRDFAQYDEAVRYYQQSVALHRASGNLSGLAYTLAELGSAHILRKDLSGGSRLLKESLHILRQIGDRPSVAYGLGGLSMLLMNEGKIVEAHTSLDKCIAIFADLGNEVEVAFWMVRLGYLFDLLLGQYDEVRVHVAKHLPLFRQSNHQFGVGYALFMQGWAELSQARFAEARPLLLESANIFHKINQPDEMMRAIVALGILAYHQNDLDQAQAFLVHALDFMTRHETWAGMSLTLPAIGLVYLREDKVAEAVRLYELVCQSPTVAASVFHADFARRYIYAAAATLPAETVAAAQRLGREQDFWPACRTLLADLRAAGWHERKPGSIGQLLKSDQTRSPETGRLPGAASRYVIEAPLAAGGMGEVFLGRDALTGERVAIKRLSADLTQNASALARFTLEGEALRRLNHPNIVKILDTVSDGEAPLIVMEYVPGGDLRRLLQHEGKLSIRQTVEIALEVADALARAHHLGIIHRDLKPGNILLADDGTPRLTDFGLVRLGNRQTRLTRAGSFMGTPDYVSPEMCLGRDVDARGDVWSLGILLYEMLTGDVPFAAEFAPMIIMSIINDPLPDVQAHRPDTPPRLTTLIKQMLQKEPANRTVTARLVAAELEMIRNDLSHTAV
jgi:predicted ATPase/tRNA A-37 threonylcarbamoyl transferase component Bud32